MNKIAKYGLETFERDVKNADRHTRINKHKSLAQKKQFKDDFSNTKDNISKSKAKLIVYGSR